MTTSAEKLKLTPEDLKFLQSMKVADAVRWADEIFAATKKNVPWVLGITLALAAAGVFMTRPSKSASPASPSDEIVLIERVDYAPYRGTFHRTDAKKSLAKTVKREILHMLQFE